MTHRRSPVLIIETVLRDRRGIVAKERAAEPSLLECLAKLRDKNASRPLPAAAVNAVALERPLWASHITFMALSRKKATAIALDPEDDRLLSRAARERGVSRSEFVRQHLALVLEQYRRHPKPGVRASSAG
jgi:hypothetical protein